MNWHDNLLIHDSSLRSLLSIARSLPHSTILTGQPGVGTHKVATMLAKSLSNNVVVISGLESIKVKDIRDMMSFVKTKSTQTRIFIIDNAETMTQSAQNAFLKILEEPVVNTHFILTTHNLQGLLPTVRSRCQEVFLYPISEQQTVDLMDNLHIHDEKTRKQIHFIAPGLPAEIARLNTDEGYFQNVSTDIEAVRTLIQGSIYDKVILIQSLKDDRSKSINVIEKSILVVRRLLTSQASPQLIQKLDGLITASARLKQGANIRLQLLHASLISAEH